ncbi:ccd4,nced4 [Orobanche minor]
MKLLNTSYMETLSIPSSSFLPRHSQLLSLRFRASTNPNKITSKSSLTQKAPFQQTTKPTFDKILIKNSPERVEPTKKKQSLLANIFNTLDGFICAYLDSPLRPSIDPERFLNGHSAPVDELPPTACLVVEGSLPSSLNGAYIRNGPNPQFVNPNGKRRPHHIFEGDGMLHMIKISKGEATLCSRYVKTHKHVAEREVGYPFVPGVFSSFNGVASSVARLMLIVARVCAGEFDPATHGMGTSNVSVALFGGRLFSLSESTFRTRLNGEPEFLRMTAHPKIDRATGEAFGYEYDVKPPFLTFFRTDGEGRKQKGVPIFSTAECTATHDFAVTKNYAVFPDGPIVVRPSWVWKGRSPIGINHGKITRLGIIPRYAEDDSEMMWLDTPGLNMMHCFNAWEEDGGDRIVLVGSNGSEVGQYLEDFRLSEFRLEKITIDVKEKKVERETLSGDNLDLGVINPAYHAKKNRYVYAGLTDKTSWAGVVKLDLSLTNDDGRIVASRLYGQGCNGGEPFFVAREPNNPAAEEDDGYLITYVHDEVIQESKFLVMDARSPTLDIIAAVKLPQRIPDGFHGLFVSESDLEKL